MGNKLSNAFDLVDKGDINAIQGLFNKHKQELWKIQDEVSGDYVIHRAVEKKRLNIIKYAVENGANARETNNKNDTALHCAVESGYEAGVLALLESPYESQLMACNDLGLTPLHLAIRKSDEHTSCLKHIVEATCKAEYLNIKNGKGESAGHMSIMCNSTTAIETLIATKQLKTTISSTDGCTMMHLACIKGKHKHLEILLKNEFETNVTMEDGQTPLHCACRHGHSKSIELLFDQINNDLVLVCRDSKGDTPLHKLEESKLDDEAIINVLKKLDKEAIKSILVLNDAGKIPFSDKPDIIKALELDIQPIPNDKPCLEIQLASDIHLEVGHEDLDALIKPKAKYLALIGDIGVVHNPEKYEQFLLLQAKNFEKVFVLSGNHEFYKGEYNAVNEAINSICDKHESLEFLNARSVMLEGIKVIGACMWSFAPSKEAKDDIGHKLNDYRYIKIKEGDDEPRVITPDDTNKWFEAESKFIKSEIAKAKEENQQVIVLTHHAPVIGMGCSNPDFWNSLTNHAFGTNLRELFGSPVSLWCYGHTHWFHDMVIDGTRVVSNAHGYQQSKGYTPTKVLKVYKQ